MLKDLPVCLDYHFDHLFFLRFWNEQEIRLSLTLKHCFTFGWFASGFEEKKFWHKLLFCVCDWPLSTKGEDRKHKIWLRFHSAGLQWFSVWLSNILQNTSPTQKPTLSHVHHDGCATYNDNDSRKWQEGHPGPYSQCNTCSWFQLWQRLAGKSCSCSHLLLCNVCDLQGLALEIYQLIKIFTGEGEEKE